MSPIAAHLVAEMTDHPAIGSTEPHSPERRLAILHANREQYRQIRGAPEVLVVCGGCHNVEVDVLRGHRCFYCDVVFCRVCAFVHFGPDNAQNEPKGRSGDDSSLPSRENVVTKRTRQKEPLEEGGRA